MTASERGLHTSFMQLQHCERCRFNFEATEPGARCPQCGGEAVPAEHADRAGRDQARTQELQILDASSSGRPAE